MNKPVRNPEVDNSLASQLGARTLDVLDASQVLVAQLVERSLSVVTVESCTGGAVANFITSISGSSAVLEDSFITYSNQAKIALGVPEFVIKEHTVYSTQTALAMAQAGLTQSVCADIAIGITGSLSRIDPANDNSIPGEVYLGIVFGEKTIEQKLIVPEENRAEAKITIAERAINAMSTLLER